MDSLIDTSCRSFATELAAKQSVPGGGGAAALVGALGVALGSMAGNFTAGKPAYADVEDDIQRMLAQGETIRCRLLDLVDEDAEAFYPLSQAYATPKEDPSRADVLEAATKAAIQAPFQMMQQVCLAIELLEEMEAKGSRMLISDVGCGAALCSAALRAASMNVFVNTHALRDEDFAAETDAACDEMLAEYLPRAGAIANRVEETIRSAS